MAAKASEMELSIEDSLNEHAAVTQEGSSLHVAKGHSCLTGPVSIFFSSFLFMEVYFQSRLIE